ncbi:NUDIX hydrolase [Pseudalkalibacillus caeni]|uniref:CoA pyrophosphatase n=1 Tax=Exobacillus caeni TaxID=2574798 RepID=A0A5R9F3B0_9BACL|nr:CoA pyrophosphatase [Pseudalkalibacillus caeni]TLS38172.1 CoA pyrophosphatase [Pseudalkalibacillus caeni]
MAKELDKISKVVKNREAKILGSEKFFKSAVFLPLIEKNGEVHVLFEVRAKHMRRQPGEICFPGGKVDLADKDEQSAAIRETCEELGVTKDQIKPLASLDYVVTSFRSMIYPFVGVIEADAQLSLNQAEVHEVFTVPLQFFIEKPPDCHTIELHIKPEETFPFHLIPNGEDYKWSRGSFDEYFYHYENYVIWGLTARILHHFVEVIT